MSNFPPDHCPYCGTELDAVDEPAVYFCESCDRWVFHNPTPSARVMVVDGDRFLLVKQGVGAVEGKWLTPGGKIEIGNGPAEHAAVELEEETGLTVDPDDLVLCDATAVEAPENHHIVSILYAVEYADTTGTLEAGDDAAEARFWTLPEFASALGDEHREYVEGMADLRRAALDALGLDASV